MKKARWHLVIMVRAPRIGRVKSRLAKGIGAIGAWRFYRETTEAVARRLAGDGRWRCWLSVTPDGDAEKNGAWLPGVPRMKQGGGDLGARIMRPMRLLPPGPVVLIGSDVPGVIPSDIREAFRLLGRCDAVFGPAEDGGYWLVGFSRTRRLPQKAFDNVRWSTEHALSDTLRNLDGLSVGFVRTLPDVDDAEAYARWLAGRKVR